MLANNRFELMYRAIVVVDRWIDATIGSSDTRFSLDNGNSGKFKFVLLEVK